MPRRNITFTVGEHYHVYNRGNDRQPIFFERDNQLFFLRQLRTYVVDHADILAYCLMSNHYHLLVRLTTDGFSSAMHRFGVSYVKAINRRHERVGTLFQGRFRAIHVDREEYLVHLSRYIHLNPVAAGLVDRPEQWEFSSYLEYICQRQGTLPKCDWLQTVFPTVDDYRRFVESVIGKDDARVAPYIFDEGT